MPSLFYRILGKEDREARVDNALTAPLGETGEIFLVNQSEFKKLPFGVYGYWCSEKFRNCFHTMSPLESFGKASVGLQTSDDFRFLPKKIHVWMM